MRVAARSPVLPIKIVTHLYFVCSLLDVFLGNRSGSVAILRSHEFKTLGDEKSLEL